MCPKTINFLTPAAAASSAAITMCKVILGTGQTTAAATAPAAAATAAAASAAAASTAISRCNTIQIIK